MQSYDELFNRLAHSKFRSKFKLKDDDLQYINNKGIDTIKNHAYDFISKRLASMNNPKDGKQTPMKGHPVFIAQHATATCCRECLEKWHHIKKNHNLNEKEINYIVNIIMLWINRNV